jgi:hypothetical protein
MGIGHSSTLAVLTPAFIYPVILSLLAMPPIQLLAMAMSESSNTISPCHGRLLNSLTHNRKEKKHASDLTPYPLELILFEPINSANAWYGQLYKPFGANLFEEAGVKGFSPPALFQVAHHYLNVGDYKDFHWPMLAKLNDKLDPFPWKNEEERRSCMNNDALFSPLVLYTGPLPSLSQPCASSALPPLITDLSLQIITSADKLFFIAHTIGNAASRKWHLVCIAFGDSISLHPSALQDRQFLVEFYVPHPNNVRFNATNQWFWLQYRDHTAPTFGTMDTHLITPLDTSEKRALHQHLVPVRCWVNLTHSNTFIQGPFDFATIHGCKTQDRIDQDAWNALSSKSSMIVNKVPCFDLPMYSIHLDCSVHSIFTGMAAVSHHEPLPQS